MSVLRSIFLKLKVLLGMQLGWVFTVCLILSMWELRGQEGIFMLWFSFSSFNH